MQRGSAPSNQVANIRAVLITFLLASAAGRVAAQQADIADFREAALAALGGAAATLEFGGGGFDACLGQAWDVNEGWARWELTDYRRAIDYQTLTSTQSAIRRAGLDPDRVGGCGAQVGAAAARQQSSIGPTADFAARLPILLTPHGVIALAGSVDAEVERDGRGWQLSLSVPGNGVTHTVEAKYDANRLPTTISTRIDDPVFGDMAVVAALEDYRDFGGIMFPASIRVTQGGRETLVLAIDSVTAGVPAPEIPPARAFGGGGGAPADSAAIEIGDGVFALPGAYQAVAVEFDDYILVIDGLQSDARTAEIIDETHAAIPGKPIRFIVNTHSHFDHASGLRQYAAEGATILTHDINVPFFREALASPRTLTAARIEPAEIAADVQGIGERTVFADESGQRVELIPLGPSPHAADMLIAWLPRIATVVESDLLQPWINPVFAGDGEGPHPYLAYLYAELERAGLDYRQFVPVHTPPAPPLMARSALENAVLPDAGGVSAGHLHLNVPDVARHRDIWTGLGGVARTSGPLEIVEFPGIEVLLTEAEPSAPSTVTTANHFGFSVRDYADYRARLAAAGASFFFEDAENGQILADLPDGVRVEILTDPEQAEPIVFHHMHLSVPDAEGLRDWYLRVFGAEPGERRGLPSAVVPGGRVDFIPARGDAPAASRGGAIDHIGFEVDDLDAFATRMARLGIEFDFGPMTLDDLGLSIAFITDPAGTYIEITEGLRAAE